MDEKEVINSGRPSLTGTTKISAVTFLPVVSFKNVVYQMDYYALIVLN